MSVRAANFADIPAIAGLMAEAHGRSRYAKETTFDELEAKQLLVRGIQRHNHTNYGASLVLVAERDGRLNGFILGFLDLLYPCLKELKATDLLFYMSEGADIRDARLMLKTLMTWAERNPKVLKVELGITDAVIDWKKAEPIYRSVGMVQCGAIFEFVFDRSAKQAVSG